MTICSRVFPNPLLGLQYATDRAVYVAVEDQIELLNDIFGETGDLRFVTGRKQSSEGTVFNRHLEHLDDR